MPRRDIFICHAHADKGNIARPLADALRRHAVSCWLDEAVIQPGDSIIDAVGEGLSNADFVVVLVTEAFLERQWTQKELNAALTKELRTATPVVIPVLSIPADDFAKRYPLLADKLCLDWSTGAEHVATQIARRFDRPTAPDWHHVHPDDYVGLIWTRVLPRIAAPGEQQHVVLRWGAYIRHCEFVANGLPISLMHHRMVADSAVLHVELAPAATVTFGQGAAPDEDTLNIDEGWTRTAGWHRPDPL